MAVYCHRHRLRPAAGCRRAGRGRQERGWRRGWRACPSDLFVRAEMDNHLWAEALRAGLGLGPEGIRAEVAEEVLRSGSRYLQSGGCARLVTGALAGCIGIVLPECGHLSLRILRCPATRGGAEHVESVH